MPPRCPKCGGLIAAETLAGEEGAARSVWCLICGWRVVVITRVGGTYDRRA